MKRPTHMTVALCGLFLFLMFSLCMLFALILGANSYKDISNSMSIQFKERTCINYVSEKIRHYDTTGSVKIINKDNTTVLTLKEDFDGAKYNTLIYHYDGKIYELFTMYDDDFSLGDGIAVMEIENISFEQIKNNLLKIICKEDGRVFNSIIALQSEKVGEVIE